MTVFIIIIAAVAAALIVSLLRLRKSSYPAITFITGSMTGKSVRVNCIMIGGRNPEVCNFKLLFPEATAGVSGKHFRLRPMQEYIELTDLGSSCGTFVNGERLRPNEPHLLHIGDRVQLGSPDNEFIMINI